MIQSTHTTKSFDLSAASRRTVRPALWGCLLLMLFWANAAQAAKLKTPEYTLYKNSENYGIVLFPKGNVYPALADALTALLFEQVESGQSVMRYGIKEENETFMMPLEVQKKHQIEKFIVIQIIAEDRMLIGVYDPEWGLTLPSSVFTLEQLNENIPKTLNVFRGDAPRRQILWEPQG